MNFRLGAKRRGLLDTSKRHSKVNEDCEAAQATTPKVHSRRVYIMLVMLSAQGLITTILSLIFYWQGGGFASLSALIGGLIAILPTQCLALFYFRTPAFGRKPWNPKGVLARLYLGEILKWILTSVLFILAFQANKLTMLPLFVSFGMTQLAFMAILLLKPLQLLGKPYGRKC